MGKDTMSFKELQKRFPRITTARSLQLLRVISSKLKVSMLQAEEMICCLSKDINKRDAFVEPSMVDQTYRIATKDGYFQLTANGMSWDPYEIPNRPDVLPHQFASTESPWCLLMHGCNHNSASDRERIDKLTAPFDNTIIPVLTAIGYRKTLPSVIARKSHARTLAKKVSKPVPKGLMDFTEVGDHYKAAFCFRPTCYSPCELSAANPKKKKERKKRGGVTEPRNPDPFKSTSSKSKHSKSKCSQSNHSNSKRKCVSDEEKDVV